MTKFGINSTDLSSAAAEIGDALGVAFRLHESAYRGGDYFRAKVANGVIFLQSNRDLHDGEPFESNWPIDSLILLLDGLDAAPGESYAEILRHLTQPTAKELE